MVSINFWLRPIDDSSESWDIALEIRKKLKQYNIPDTFEYNVSLREEWHRILAFLKGQNIDLSYNYSFNIDYDKLDEYPAYILGIKDQDNVFINNRLNYKVVKRYDIVEDFDSDRIILSQNFKDEIESTGVEIKYLDNFDNVKYYELERNCFFPEPVTYSKIWKLSEPDPRFPDAGHGVYDDGRKILSQNNLKYIKNHGVCFCNKFEFEDKVYKLYPSSLVVTNELLSTLYKKKYKGLIKFTIPFLRYDDKLLKGF